MLRDQIVYDISSTSLRERLLQNKGVTLEVAVNHNNAEKQAQAENKASEEKSVTIEPVMNSGGAENAANVICPVIHTQISRVAEYLCQMFKAESFRSLLQGEDNCL